MATAFVSHGVVPDVIPAPPPVIARVEYSTSSHVNLGNVLPVTGTQRAPNIYFPNVTGVYYTVMMVDPDAKSRTTHEWRNFCHWLSVNVPGADGEILDLNKGHAVVPYMGPAPPPGSDLHRYCFLIYRQHAKLQNEDKIKSFGEKIDERKSFDPTLWLNQTFPNQTANSADSTMATKSPPIELLAGNFFLAEVPGGKDDKDTKNKDKGNDQTHNKDKDDK